jgi:hypothetical protein
MKRAQPGSVHAMMKNFVFVFAIAACGNKGQTQVSNAGSGDPPGPVRDTRTELERRRDTACEQLGPRITDCAVADAKAALDAGQLKQKDFDAVTKPEIKAKNTKEFVDDCSGKEFSSRQIRVLEVCQTEETECEPMLACLDNLNKQ